MVTAVFTSLHKLDLDLKKKWDLVILNEKQLGAGTDGGGLSPEILVAVSYLEKQGGRPVSTKHTSPPALLQGPSVRMTLLMRA